MELVNIKDEEDNTILFKRYLGRPFHPDFLGNVRDHLADIAAYQCRPDDVMLCTFPKSGTHWVFNMVQMLRSNSLAYSGTPNVMEFHPISDIDKLKPPRMYLTHLCYPFVPAAVKQGHVKVIHVLRNPKDTAVSYYQFFIQMKNMAYEGNFEGFLKYFLSEEFVAVGGSWFTYVKEWEEAKRTNTQLRVLYLRFEDMKKNLHENIVKITKFLELDRSDDFLRDVESHVTFEHMKKEHDTECGATDRWTNNAVGGRLPVYRKGVIGDWKNKFTVAQNERFDAVYKATMTEMGLDVDEFDFK